MKILDDIKLDFKDVLIVPKRSDYSSRSEVSLERTFKFKYSPLTWTGIPVIVANMDSVGTIEMARELQKYKMLTCLHKFYEWFDIPEDLDREYYIVSSGIGEKDLNRLDEIITHRNPKFICLDVANGYMKKFVNVCAMVRDKYPDKILMAGNICTGQGVQDLIVRGKVDIVKIGLGSGKACETRKIAAVGYPQLSAVIECSKIVHDLGGHIISDGNICEVADFSRAFGGGSDFVMSGYMFAGHDESGGEIFEDLKDGKKYKIFYGMSSTKAMIKHYGKVEEYRASEGREIKIPYKGSVKNTVLQILGGLRSTMTYLDAKDMEDFSKCTTFVRINHPKL